MMKYYPYGDRLESEANLPTDRLFTGQRYDETGLYYYGARYYDTEIGRFISSDTIIPNPMNPQAFNRYSYCLNNPLKYVDPSGSVYSPIYAGDLTSYEGLLAYAYLYKKIEDAYQQVVNDSNVPDWVKDYMTTIHDSERVVNVGFDDLKGESYGLSAMDIGGIVTKDIIMIDKSWLSDPASNPASILAHESYHIYEGNPGATIQEEFIAYTAQYYVEGSFPGNGKNWFGLKGGLGSKQFLYNVKNQIQKGGGTASNVYEAMPLYQSQMNRCTLGGQLAASKGLPDWIGGLIMASLWQDVSVRGIPW